MIPLYKGKRWYMLVDITVMAIGFAVVALANPLPKAWSTLLEAIGTGLLAAGLVSILIRWLHSESPKEEVKIIAERRGTMGKTYWQFDLRA